MSNVKTITHERGRITSISLGQRDFAFYTVNQCSHRYFFKCPFYILNSPSAIRSFPLFSQENATFLFSPVLTVNLRTQSATYHTFLLEVALHPSNSVHWKSLLGLAWLSCAGLELGPAAESRAKGLESVSSSLRTDQKRFALIFLFHSHLTLISQY